MRPARPRVGERAGRPLGADAGRPAGRARDEQRLRTVGQDTRRSTGALGDGKLDPPVRRVEELAQPAG
ncbi:hypothetical protein CF642_38775, partial [Burkholderia pseudomallei]